MTDEVVTHDEVLRWQPDHIRREWAEAQRAREMALPPEERGWYTADEAASAGGVFIELTTMSGRDSKFIRGR